MNFFAVNGKRPKRLSEATRRFAFDSFEHKYGQDTRKAPAVSLDDIEGFESLSPLQKYDAAIERIAKASPIRICEGEMIRPPKVFYFWGTYHVYLYVNIQRTYNSLISLHRRVRGCKHLQG